MIDLILGEETTHTGRYFNSWNERDVFLILSEKNLCLVLKLKGLDKPKESKSLLNIDLHNYLISSTVNHIF